ncbi:hypothetical protein L218DRAFT_949968 [Marasmius fiardii PR-910]|nr:hypothetical protein L218DRAFT_949968 [Marasmius fiardii PR-910]
MAEKICLIPGDSDIAGIGVRAAIYAQALLGAFSSTCLNFVLQTYTEEGVNLHHHMALSNSSFATQLRFRKRNPLVTTAQYHSSHVGLARNLERSILLIGFATIISAIIQLGNTNGLTPYHTLIVLNLISGREGFRLHTMLFIGFGIYFWIIQSARLGPFLKYIKESAPSCQPVTYYWIFGPVDITNQALKTGSLVFYFVFAVLGKHLQLSTFLAVSHTRMMSLFNFTTRNLLSPHLGFITEFLGHSSPIIYLIISTELTVKLNTPNISGSENEWSYGQTLALSTAAILILLTGREWWEILKEERGKSLERKNNAQAVELDNLPHPESAVGSSQQLEDVNAAPAAFPLNNGDQLQATAV